MTAVVIFQRILRLQWRCAPFGLMKLFNLTLYYGYNWIIMTNNYNNRIATACGIKYNARIYSPQQFSCYPTNAKQLFVIHQDININRLPNMWPSHIGTLFVNIRLDLILFIKLKNKSLSLSSMLICPKSLKSFTQNK